MASDFSKQRARFSNALLSGQAKGNGRLDGQFVRAGEIGLLISWTWRPLPGAPAPRTGATAVWTGNSMLLFGGSQSGKSCTGLSG